MPVNNLDKIDARYIDGTRASHTQVLRVDSNLDVDFEDSIRITNPSGTTGDNGTYYFTPSGEFQTFILNHNIYDLKDDLIFLLMNIKVFELIRLTIYRICKG